jgi:CRISPR-associated exonuclease Cas4
MKEYREEDYLNIAGIQHFAFCRRQWALIHIEQQWQENLRTIEGQILHEKAHDGNSAEKRGEMIVSRGMAVFSKSLGVNGVCDVVELHKTKDGVSIAGREGLYKPFPVEYKRGRPKEDDCDALQLCVQAICLEEMLCCSIPEAFLYYGEIKHRVKVPLTGELRSKVASMLAEMHELYERRYTPKVKPNKSCKACSLVDICMPKLCRSSSVRRYIMDNLDEVNIEEGIR